MKFSEMPYKRPDPEEVKKELQELTEQFKHAKSYEEARAVFLKKEEEEKAVDTMGTLAYVRHSIDTRDEFYDGEIEFWDEIGPELEEYEQAWIEAMLTSPFRADFEAEYGDLLFIMAEMDKKTFSPAIIEDEEEDIKLKAIELFQQSSFDPKKGNFDAYIGSIIRRVAGRRIRKARQQFNKDGHNWTEDLSINVTIGDGLQAIEVIPDDGPAISRERAARDKRIEGVHMVLASMSPDCRHVWKLLCDGIAQREVAAVMGISYSTFREKYWDKFKREFVKAGLDKIGTDSETED